MTASPFLRGRAVIYRGDLPTSLHVCKSCFSSRVAAQWSRDLAKNRHILHARVKLGKVWFGVAQL